MGKINYHYINHLKVRLKPFLDAHNGPFKYKYHYWFGILLCVRVVNLLISEALPSNRVFALSVIIATGTLLFVSSLWSKIYRNTATSRFKIMLLINLGLLGTFCLNITSSDKRMYQQQSHNYYILVGVAFIQFL